MYISIPIQLTVMMQQINILRERSPKDIYINEKKVIQNAFPP